MYDPQLHITEHSLEVQIPFIQIVAPDAKIVPILISDLSYAKPLAAALFKHIYGQSVLVLASTDLSHYHPDSTARQIDETTQQIFQAMSPEGFRQAYQNGTIELCGPAAVLTLLELIQLYGQCEFANLNYANSGDKFSDKSRVVGYNASLITLSDTIPEQKRSILLSFAKETLLAYLSNKTSPMFNSNDPYFSQNRAVFVTLKDKSGKLRGCIGQLEAIEPLYLAVQHMSIDAATKDGRFAPVTLSEFKDMSLEISVLDTPHKINNINDFVYGTHGVILTQGRKRGVFLPEVSHDFRTKEEFLSELCYQKADLPRNCWQNSLTEIEVFTTQTIQNPN
jgi:hypothetical protein